MVQASLTQAQAIEQIRILLVAETFHVDGLIVDEVMRKIAAVIHRITPIVL